MDLDTDRPRPVLVIDDSLSCRTLVRSQLGPEEWEVHEASDGPSGLAAARDVRPDLILLDVALPGCDGFEVIRRLKDDAATRSIPVIFISGACSTREKALGLDLGAVDFLSKPFDPIELQARIRAALRTSDLQDLLEQRAHLDGLTGLANRLSLEDRLEAEWSNGRRRGCRSPP